MRVPASVRDVLCRGLACVVAVAGALVLRPTPPAAGHAGEVVLATVPSPTGIAATPDRLYVTSPHCGDPRRILSISSTGAVSVFATLPPRGAGCFEDYLAVAGPADLSMPGFPSPTKGGFVSGWLYVIQGKTILKVSPQGVVSAFTTLPACEPHRNGLTFDDVGAFDYALLVACSGGKVWKVRPNGVATLVADVATAPGLSWVRMENPDVAPAGFAPYGGWLFVAAEVPGKVVAVSPAGTVATVASWPSVEGVHFIPAEKCNFAASGGAFFNAVRPNKVYRWPAAAFAGLSGRAVLTSEGGADIALLTATGAPTLTPTPFHGTLGHHEGSAFTDCTVPLALKIIVKPGSIPHSINPKSQGTVPVAILSSSFFDALKDPIQSSITFGYTGIERSIAFCNRSGTDYNGDGLLDRTCHARTQDLGIPGGGIYRGPLILKLRYTSGGVDPVGEGLD